MDELRHSVQNASYENKDPLLIYKLESYNLFKNMVDTMNRKTAAILMRGQIPVREEQSAATQRQQAAAAASRRIAVQQAAPERRQDMSRYRTEKAEIGATNSPEYNPNAEAMQAGRSQQKTAPIRVEKKVGRNDPCPCGSGKKYKSCHGQGL